MAASTVILVPGITGSEIRYSIRFVIDKLVWLHPVYLAAGGFFALRLPIPSESDPGPTFQARGPGGPVWGYYGSFAAYLAVRGWRVVSPVADWRTKMILDAARLADLILAEAKDGPVKILCHSRGGLLTRRALGILGPVIGPRSVSRVIGLGVPHTGSLTASIYISGDNGKLELVRELADLLPGKVVSAYAVRAISNVTRSWPALYELQPSPGNPWLDAAVTTALYNPATWSASATKVVDAYLSDSLANWAATPPVPEWLDWIDVAGVGIETPGSVPDLQALAVSGNTRFDLDGDGTVPLASANQRPRRRVATPSGHNSLIIDPRVWGACNVIFRDGLTTDLTLTGPILNL